MDLDDRELYRQLDPSRLIERITALPEQLEQAFALGRGLGMPDMNGVEMILAAGCGSSAAGADCLSAYAEPCLSVPLLVWRETRLPGWARGPRTLVIIQSFEGSGSVETSLTEQALRAGCRVFSMGGENPAAEAVRAAGGVDWIWPASLPARHSAAVLFGLQYRLLERGGLLPDPDRDLEETLAVLRQGLHSLTPDIPVARNPAKRLAGQMVGRWVMLFAGEFLAPVARYWKNQLNLMAKAGGQFEFIPEGDYNTLAGLEFPASVRHQLFTIFLRAGRQRQETTGWLDLTREICLELGLNTDFVNARGDSRLAQLWTSMLVGELCAYYLAAANGIDPATMETVDYFKGELANRNLGGM